MSWETLNLLAKLVNTLIGLLGFVVSVYAFNSICTVVYVHFSLRTISPAALQAFYARHRGREQLLFRAGLMVVGLAVAALIALVACAAFVNDPSRR